MFKFFQWVIEELRARDRDKIHQLQHEIDHLHDMLVAQSATVTSEDRTLFQPVDWPDVQAYIQKVARDRRRRQSWKDLMADFDGKNKQAGVIKKKE